MKNHQSYKEAVQLIHSVHFLSVIGCDPPDLHCDGLDDVRDSALSPRVPQDVRPRTPALLRVVRAAVEVGQAALVEPPARLVVPSAAALHRAVADGAGRIAAVVVDVRRAEGSRVLILLLIIATKRITCTEHVSRLLSCTEKQTKTSFLSSHLRCLRICPRVC